MKLLHRIAHWLGWYAGTIETWIARDGRVMVCFRCTQCGRRAGIHPIVERHMPPRRFR